MLEMIKILIIYDSAMELKQTFAQQCVIKLFTIGTFFRKKGYVICAQQLDALITSDVGVTYGACET